MKKLFLTTALILTVFITSMGNPIVAAGQTNTSFGDYKIVALDEHLTLNGREMEKYLISYEKTDMKVIVAVDKQAKCKKYYVLSGQLAVQYECNGTYFGIVKLDKELVDKGFTTSANLLDKREFFNQRILVSGQNATVEHLNLIAAYYPGLYKVQVS
jgi:hypothetical protein